MDRAARQADLEQGEKQAEMRVFGRLWREKHF